MTNADFYKSPIVLETEPDQEFLGFQMELNPFEMIYQNPKDMSQVLSPMSASPPAVLLSGFASRCSIVHKGAFPQHQVDKGLAQLKDLCLKAGIDSRNLDKILGRVLKQRKQKRLGFLRVGCVVCSCLLGDLELLGNETCRRRYVLSVFVCNFVCQRFGRMAFVCVCGTSQKK